jgi:predicted kinase
MATVHLVHGFLGAGKSRFARELAARHDAVLISIDEWYLRLHTDGTPTSHVDYELLRRLTLTLEDHAAQIIRAGVDVVLDFGFWTRAGRDRVRAMAAGAAAEHRLHWVRTDDATALSRCLTRNGEPGAFVIDEAGYRNLKPRFEPPAADERAEIIAT